VKKLRDGEDGKSREFRRLESTARELLTVSKLELDARVSEYNVHKPGRRGPKPKAI
jgi:hypothetical protein